jgi:hypothetical protein
MATRRPSRVEEAFGEPERGMCRLLAATRYAAG